MNILVVGRIGCESVVTPVTAVNDPLAGYSSYCTISASYFAPVALIPSVGGYFRDEGLLARCNAFIKMIPLDGLWSGESLSWHEKGVHNAVEAYSGKGVCRR